MKRLVFGVLAHVDSGKTTLSEALLYAAGAIRALGRVDHGDAFLDNFDIERKRGITIFSKQALLETGDTSLTLLDTPGHVDFSSETERTLEVLDYAVLVVSATDGVQAHTETLWKLLKRHHIPTFLFVNKMDLAGPVRSGLLKELKERFGDGFIDFSREREELLEDVSLCEEGLLDRYLEQDDLDDGEIARLIRQRKIFPCFFGAALRLQGVDALLGALDRWTVMPDYPETFGARVFKIARDDKDERLTYLKVTGGVLRARDTVSAEDWEEKAQQLRLYSGARFTPLQAAPPGTVCAVTGLSRTWPGMGLGCERTADAPVLEPVLTYRLLWPEDVDAHTMLGYMRRLQEEDPQLRVEWNENLQQINLRLMGEIQLEVLRQLVESRFGVAVDFDRGGIVYLETITEPVEGVGHYEPLRHYAEVRLLLQPGERGSGLVFDSDVSVNKLDLNWQRLILTHLHEKTHRGVLTGAPITDMKITLIAGRASLKHTEGGDFRQATYRAVRQGLKRAKSILLEPWYDFRIQVPQENVGRVLADVQRMSGRFDPPETAGEDAVVTGAAPVSEMMDYQREVVAFTRGRGKCSFSLSGYEPCHNEQTVVEAVGYDSDRDLDNPADSVFCDHGAGFSVPWYKVPSMAHTESPLKTRLNKVELEPPPEVRRSQLVPFSKEEEELLSRIFEMTFGANAGRKSFAPVRREHSGEEAPAPRVRSFVPRNMDEYLLVDGYNIIFAWDELRELSQRDLNAARDRLIDILCNYRGYRGSTVILVFDAYKVKGGTEKVEQVGGIYVVYTKEKETADMYIERTTYKIARQNRVRVATSDGMEQMIILGHGAIRVPASELYQEVTETNARIREILQAHNE